MTAPVEVGATRGLLQIGDVADRTGLSLRTVRHYEEVGLLPVADRSPGGFRLYTDEAVTRLLVIKQMKPLEFTLEQMREVLDALDALDDPATDEATRAALLARLAEHREAVDTAIAKLTTRLEGGRAFRRALDERLS